MNTVLIYQAYHNVNYLLNLAYTFKRLLRELFSHCLKLFLLNSQTTVKYGSPSLGFVVIICFLKSQYSAINEFRLGEYMSDYDVEIARKIASVICGGDLTGSQKVSEKYLLDIEREGFMSLLGNQKTLDRPKEAE